MRFKIDWIKPTSHGISGGKQPGRDNICQYVNRGQLCLFPQKETTMLIMQM